MDEKEFRRLLKKFVCVGCGWCCHIGDCWPGSKYYYKQKGMDIDTRFRRIEPPCPYVVWSEEDGRYWCSIFDEFDEIELKEGLYYGLGCNDPLNAWRKEMVLEARRTGRRK